MAESTTSLLGRVPVFQGLPLKQLEILAVIAEPITYQANQQIITEGRPADGFFLIVAGQVKVFKLSLDGKEQVLHFVGAGEIFAEVPVFSGGTYPANAAALIMLGASAVQIGKYIMQAAAGCLGAEADRCNICNIGRCPKGITSQDPRLYRRLNPELVAERVVDVFLGFDTELKKIVAPLGRSPSLPIGMSDALGIADKGAAERLQIKYVV